MAVIYRIIMSVVIVYLTITTSEILYVWLFPLNSLTDEIKVSVDAINNINLCMVVLTFLFYIIIYKSITPIILVKLSYYDDKLKESNVIHVVMCLFVGVVSMLISLVILGVIDIIFVVNNNIALLIIIMSFITGLYLTYILKEQIPIMNKYKKSSNREYIIDTSALIDGRVEDLYVKGLINGVISIPDYVLKELQTIADSTDNLKRTKGQRGLKTVRSLKEKVIGNKDIWNVVTSDNSLRVDDKLIEYCKASNKYLITTDYNLSKVFESKELKVININNLVVGLKTDLVEGDIITVIITKKGNNRSQGVGNLEDGTLVVVENAKDLIGEELDVKVKKVHYKDSGRILFSEINK